MKHKLTLTLLTLLSIGTSSWAGVGVRTKALANDAWQESVWISAKDAQVITTTVNDGTRSADGASWFATTIKNPQKVVKATWMTAGLGVYQLYVNGQPVGDDFLKPGFTHYAKTKRSFTYDITSALACAPGKENVLSVQSTPGWWADKIITPAGSKGTIGKKVAFRGVLEVTYKDGSTKRYGTNLQDWKAGVAGRVTHASIFDGEDYDARNPMGYESISKFQTPEENTEFKGEILPSEGAEICLRNDLELKPVKAYTWRGVQNVKDHEHGIIANVNNLTPGKPITLKANETLVIDFGQNAAAIPNFVFKADEGTILTCLPSELLNDGNGAESRGMDGPEGSIHRTNLRAFATSFRNVYTFGSEKDFVQYHPTCTFFGYRFLSITATKEVTFKSITSIPVTSITQEMETGTITTGSKDINKLISNTMWGQRSNYLSVPTDCPQRNERLGWTADTQVFTETGSFFANTDQFFHKWMRDMRDTQTAEGAFPGVAPVAQYGGMPWDMMRVGWADAGVIVPWTVWKQFGDKSIIEENWEAMDRFIKRITETKYDHKALVKDNNNYQWADWLSYEPLESCSRLSHDGAQPKPEAITYWNYLSASYWAIDAEMMIDMAKATGRDVVPYQKIYREAIGYLRQGFLDEQGNFKLEILNTMQTPTLFGLKNNLWTGEQKARVIARLRDNFKQHDMCLQTGFLGTSILMKTLTENGMTDIAYELLFQHKNPSWLYSVDNGATTIWERWNSYTMEKGMGPKGMNSFNHYAYGCVCQWIWQTAAGIASDPAEPGFRHIIMRPIPDKRLGSIKAAFNSAAGPIKSEWAYKGDKWTWKFSIPKGATATVTLPGQTTSKEYKAGNYSVTLTL